MSARRIVHVPKDMLVSVKDEKNVSLDMDYVDISLTTFFLDARNVAYLTKEQFTYHRDRGGKQPYAFFVKQVPNLMIEFSKKENLETYSDALGYNWREALSFINVKFVKKHDDVFTHRHRGREGDLEPDVNVFKEKYHVGTYNTYDGHDMMSKKPTDMTAADFSTLDVWQKQTTSSGQGRFNYRDKLLKTVAESRHARHFDRGNDGLRAQDYRASSREVPVRGYGQFMKAIYQDADSLTDFAWQEF